MSLRGQLLDLTVTVNQITSGVNAVTLISMGLDRTIDLCMDGFDASAAICPAPDKSSKSVGCLSEGGVTGKRSEYI